MDIVAAGPLSKMSGDSEFLDPFVDIQVEPTNV